MTKQELGERTRIIREEILHLTQEELAEELGTAQALVSRMERAGMGTLEHLLSLLNYYEKRGLRSQMLFYTPFQKDLLPINNNTTNIDQVLHFAELMKDKFNGDFNKLLLLINTL